MVESLRSWIERFRTRPLTGRALLAVGSIMWVAGALYCSGYETLTSGIDNWPASLVWSAVAVLPWLALFEWTKTKGGQRFGPIRFAVLFVAVAIASVAAEAAINLLQGKTPSPIALLLLRRVPAIGASLLLILWSRAGQPAEDERAGAEKLCALAPSIDWVAAADNYVELHIAGRTVMRRMTLRDAEQALAGRGFVRIHRRYLVNRHRIAAISGGTDLLVRLEGGIELPVGRAFANNLAQAA